MTDGAATSEPRADPDYYGRVPVWNRIPFRRRKQLLRLLGNGLVAVAMFIVLFPLLWAVNTSIRVTGSIRSTDVQLVSTNLTLQHYVELMDGLFPVWVMNSVVVSLGVITLTTVLATLGGYGLTRIDLRYKRTFARGVLFGYMFPPILLGIPMFIFWREIGIINSHVGLILAETALSLPFSLWLMWKFFQGIPYSLEESAQMAGATRFQALIDIVLPMAKPGVIAVVVYSFAVAWNQYTIAKIIMPQREMFVITTGLDTLVHQNLVDWGQMMAASTIAVIPAFLLVYFLQKHLIRGFNV